MNASCRVAKIFTARFPPRGGGTRFVDAPARFHGETVGMTCVRATETGSVDATAAFPSAASAAIAVQEAEGKDMVELLLSKAEMIDEYFAIRLSASGADGAAAAASEEVPVAGSEASPSAVLVTLPVLVEQYEPYWYRTVHLPSSVPAFESWRATDSSLTTGGDVVGPSHHVSCRVVSPGVRCRISWWLWQ